MGARKNYRGDYGVEASYDLKEPGDPAKGFVYKLPTLAPPMARLATVEMFFQSAPEQCEHILAFNDFEFEEYAALPGMTETSFVPFRPSSEANPSLYLGFGPPSETRAEERPTSIYFRLKSGVLNAGDTPKEQRLKLMWEYWDGALGVRLLLKMRRKDSRAQIWCMLSFQRIRPHEQSLAIRSIGSECAWTPKSIPSTGAFKQSL